MNNCQQCGGFVSGDDTCPKDGARGMFTNIKPVAPSAPVPHGGVTTPPGIPVTPYGVPQVGPKTTPLGARPSDANQIPRPDGAGGVPRP